MATQKSEIQNSYPLPIFNFKVEIETESIAFSEVSGLSVGIEHTVYKESGPERLSGPSTIRLPGQQLETTLTLKKGVMRRGSVDILYGWLRSNQLHNVLKKDIFIRLCDEKGIPMLSWKIVNAFPVRLDAPTFDATSSEVAVETMELVADTVLIAQT